MGQSKEYSAIPIPQRKVQDAAPKAGPVFMGSTGASYKDAIFAEIEFNENPGRTTAGGAALQFFSSVTPAEPVNQGAFDPIRQKFYDMRRLSADRRFARNDAELFYRQAKFMADFTDDYEGDERV